MPGRLSDGERSSESRSTALRRGATFGNMRKLTTRPGGVGQLRASALTLEKVAKSGHMEPAVGQ